MKLWIFGLLLLPLCQQATALEQRREVLPATAVGAVQTVSGTITGYETVDYVVGALASQIILVDLQSRGAGAYFNLQEDGEPVALFVGSRDGNVADVPAPADGDYVIRVYQMRASARREETAQYSVAISIGAPEFADGLFGGPDYWAVTGLSEGSALNVRTGPDTRYTISSILRNGDVLENRGCRLTGEMRWCNIRETGSGVTGWGWRGPLSERNSTTASACSRWRRTDRFRHSL